MFKFSKGSKVRIIKEICPENGKNIKEWARDVRFPTGVYPDFIKDEFIIGFQIGAGEYNCYEIVHPSSYAILVSESMIELITETKEAIVNDKDKYCNCGNPIIKIVPKGFNDNTPIHYCTKCKKDRI